MTKQLLSLAAAAAFLVFAVPAYACDMHQSHASLTTAQVAPVPVPEVKPVNVIPVTVIRTPVVMPAETEAMSKPTLSENAYQGCNRRAKEQTVYLTQ